MQEHSDKEKLIYGTVEEALPNALFRVLIDGEEESQIAYLAGKMRKFRIRVLVGDKVAIVPDPYGGKGRITKRL
ncbi:MAG: translation initiation factor IF-1 [Candidatus Pacebacteria bacterium]|nr:translation initiation factor IF-1 [Candidatus Paceibacterota bacterium]